MYGRHIIYTKLKKAVFITTSPPIPSTSITHPTTLAMIYVLHPPSWLPPSLPILLYLHPTQRKEEEDFSWPLSYFNLISNSSSPASPVSQYSSISPSKPPPFLYPSHTVRPPARVIYMPSISLSLSIYLIIFVNIVNALLVNLFFFFWKKMKIL